MVKLCLRLAVSTEDVACPLCDGAADKFGDHARVCPCGGDRVKRRNELRNLVVARSKTVGLQPEIEKANLLPPRPELSGGAEDGSTGSGSGGRRPADVWLPSMVLLRLTLQSLLACGRATLRPPSLMARGPPWIMRCARCNFKTLSSFALQKGYSSCP